MTDLTKRIVYTSNEGTVALVFPSPEYLEEGNSIEDIALKDVPVGTDYLIVEADTLPQDHTYFGAWEIVNGEVVVNLEKAQLIATNNLNAWAKQEYLDRAVDDAIGVQSAARLTATEDFATILQRGRDAIAAATSVAQLTPIVLETEAEAKDAPLEVSK